MINIETIEKGKLKYHIVRENGEIKDIILENEYNSFDMVREIYYSEYVTHLEKYYLDDKISLEKFDSDICYDTRRYERVEGRFWNRKKIVEEHSFYYPTFEIKLSPEITKLGIVEKYVYQVEPNVYRLKKEYIGKIWDNTMYFFERYLYCLNFLDWPDIDYWAEETLK